MADAPWQPRPLAHREALAALVARYGPMSHPPGWGDTWSGRFTFTDGCKRNGVRPGGGHCMWCGGHWHHGVTHREGCPVHRADRLEALALQIPAAEVAVQVATDRLAKLVAERDALGGAP